VTGAARLPLVPWWCIAGTSRDLAVLTVLIPWDGCPSACWAGAPLIAIAVRNSRAASKSSATDFRISWPRAALSLLRFPLFR
jgi:hypothetical protein